MGAFALLRGVGPEEERVAAGLDELFGRQGFRERRTLRLAGWTIVLCGKIQAAAGVPDGLYRVGMGANGTTPFARVRTLQADIALRNHLRANWP